MQASISTSTNHISIRKRTWSRTLGGAVASFALMTSLCRKGYNTQPKKTASQTFVWAFSLWVRTFVRTDICSNHRKVELMSVRTNVPQLFWQFFKSSNRITWATKMADPSLESLLHINKDGIRNKAYLER